MSEAAQLQEIVRKTVVVTIPGMEKVEVRESLPFGEATGEAEPLTFDLYLPSDAAGRAGALPVVVLIAGYPDPGFRQRIGCGFREMGSTVSWGRLIAASGMAAVAYGNREPTADLRALLEHLRQNGSELGLDPARIGLWASSGNVPLALLPLLGDSPVRVRCAALLYGYLLDLEGEGPVAATARQFGFANPCAGRSLADLDPGTALLLARAGQEQFPGLNETMERFFAAALAANRPIAMVNHPEGPHAFDLFHDSERTREIVLLVLDFLRFHLAA